eukprot:g8761.t1
MRLGQGQSKLRADVVPVNSEMTRFPGVHTADFCVCASGGGARALTYTMGVYRALQDMGIMEQLDGISSVSGGTWASSIYMFAREFQGEAIEAIAARKGNSTQLLWQYAGSYRDNLVWTHVVADLILKPFGLESFECCVAESEEEVKRIKEENPGIQGVPFHPAPLCCVFPCWRNALTVRVGGGFIESFAFGGDAPDDEAQRGGKVEVPTPDTNFSLPEMVGISSYAPASKFSNRRLTSLWLNVIWIASSYRPLQDYDFEGATIDNFDPDAAGVIDQLSSLFGYGLNDQDEGYFYANNQVFKKSQLLPICRKLFALKSSGKPMVLKESLDVLPNSYWGIRGDYQVSFVLIYLDECAEFQQQLPQEVRDEIAKGPNGMLENYPIYKTNRAPRHVGPQHCSGESVSRPRGICGCALNRLLLEPSEVSQNQALLAMSDRRARHVAKVLQLRDGDALKQVRTMAFLRRLPMTAARNLCATNRAVSGSGGMPGGLSHIEGELVGFENGDILKPRVKLQSGQLVTAVCDAHVVLRFRQRCLPRFEEAQVDLLLVPPPLDRLTRLLPQLVQLGIGTLALCQVPGGDREVFHCHLLRSERKLRELLVNGLEQSGQTQMGNICRPPPQTAVGAGTVGEAPEQMEEEVGMNCLMSNKLNCFHKSDSFEITGSEASTPGPKTLHGYVPVTPISASSYDAMPEADEECPKSERRGGHGETVYLHLYDLNDTFAHMNSVSLDLLGLGGALHVGVEVLGNEWSFGMQGVSITTPKQNQYYTYRQTVAMGRTGLKRKEVEGAILALKRRWSGVEYDLLDRNCGHFCNELCQALGVGRMPSWVTRVAETMALMPGSHTLKNSISRAMMEDQGAVFSEIEVSLLA